MFGFKNGKVRVGKDNADADCFFVGEGEVKCGKGGKGSKTISKGNTLKNGMLDRFEVLIMRVHLFLKSLVSKENGRLKIYKGYDFLLFLGGKLGNFYLLKKDNIVFYRMDAFLIYG